MKKIILSVLVIFGSLMANAEGLTADTLRNPYIELSKIHSFYRDTDRISFDCTYYMEDIDTVTVYDTLAGFYKMHGDKYWIVMDSMESLQDDAYSMTAHHDQETLFIKQRMSFTQKMTQVNLYDTTLTANYLDSVKAWDSTGALRVIRFYFKPEIQFDTYKIVYDTSYKLIQINYSVRKYPFVNEDLSSTLGLYFTKIRIEFTNYQFSGFTDDVFSTSKFAVRQNGAFTLVSPYTNYDLVNTTNQ